MSTKVHLVKVMVFPVGMYGCESWTIKKTECQKLDVFQLLCWRILLRVPWTARRSNQSILKEISPGCSLEGLMLKLQLQYFDHLMWRADSWKAPDVKAVYCHPAYLTYMQNTSWEMLGWKKHKLESRLPGEISITSDMQMTPPLWEKVKRNHKASWWKWRRRVKKLA